MPTPDTTRRCGTCDWWWTQPPNEVGDCGKGFGPTPYDAGSKCPDHAFAPNKNAAPKDGA